MAKTAAKLYFAPKAFIVKEGKVLVLRESSSHATNTRAGEYSLVGGRIDDDEPWQDGFAREVQEEIGSEIKVLNPLFVSESFNHLPNEDWHIIRCFFLCELVGDNITISEEHDSYKWIDPGTYTEEDIIDNEHGAFKAYLEMQ